MDEIEPGVMMVGVVCGRCGGPVYMETCPEPGHVWAIASECQRCGERWDIPGGCSDCSDEH